MRATERSIVLLKRLQAWVLIVFGFVTEKKRVAGLGHKLLAHILGLLLRLALQELNGRIDFFVKLCVRDELAAGCASSATIVMKILFIYDRFVAVRIERYGVYIAEELEEVCDYYIATIE